MKKINDVMADIIRCRKEKDMWIFDDCGNIKDDVLLCDVLDLLEELKEYEIDISDEFIEDFFDLEDVKGDNTYNYSANISNDIDYYWTKIDGDFYVLAKVHLFGDVRGNYSDYFALKITKDFDISSNLRVVDIDGEYYAEVDMFSDSYDVYDYDDNFIGCFYEIEKDDLIEQIAEVKKQEECI